MFPRNNGLCDADLKFAKISHLRKFLLQDRPKTQNQLVAMTLFSGAGIGDIGYELAGFEICAQVELDPHRVELCKANFPTSDVICQNIESQTDEIANRMRRIPVSSIDLLSITPPCQGMSSSNPGRGKIGSPFERDKRNKLILSALPIVSALKPRIIVAENVAQVLKETIELSASEIVRVVDLFQQQLVDYEIFVGVVQMADYGIPQMRRRAILVGIHKAEPCLPLLKKAHLLPWPLKTHSDKATDGLYRWITLREWLLELQYSPLDSISKEKASCSKDNMHFVPHYQGDYYLRISDIPPDSGRNAYQNSNCHSCGRTDVPEHTAYCPYCNSEMTNRPYVREQNGVIRLIKGFDSSYRRMFPDRPAPTITTASSHVGSDYKIHPWENRVLSIRECSDLQTIPRFYNWSWAMTTKHVYVSREVIGEAIPPWFTYVHGKVLYNLLHGIVNQSELASGDKQ